ncbi:cell wall-binding protein [Clostridium beijerinckii]|uniref:Cell wall-binding protein n=1 Tax=Clostridium beijerinckii TaxID=1520 RepID=A0AAW3WI99_CLOBE|nr:cell wall-binding protein [Clostridium beijerinckii]MBC2478644.1 cell wall-binding protein [Clostridium beijerinckii]
MKSKKLRILTLALVAILAQGTCVYAASSSDDKDKYTKEDFDNMTPGFEWKDIDKSNQKVSSYINSFSSTITPEQAAKDDKSTDSTTSTTTTTSTTSTTTDSAPTDEIVTTSPSTGVKGDFWGKTKAGKWILIEQGVPVIGWRSVNGWWYYMDANGIMQTGWINDNGTWYYCNASGVMQANTTVDGYVLGASGAWIK